MATLQSSWSITAAAGQPHSIIRVQNLQTSARVGSDAWGRAEKLQPVLISASVSLREPFINASVEDTVNKSTIHYGILSKAILEAVSSFRGSSSLALSDHVFRHLLKLKPNQDTSQAATNPTVDSRLVRSLNIEIVLPKGTLLGNGVSFSETILFGGDGEHEAYSRTTKIRDLRIPTLIGVNSNERLAKQIVVANVEIDRWDTQLDYYVQLDQIVVKVSRRR
jgi:dihydroneopterin aldolase